MEGKVKKRKSLCCCVWIDVFFAWNCFKEEKWQLKETVDETQ